MTFMQIVKVAEDGRNLLMFNQKTNVEFIVSQPEDFVQKMLSGGDKEWYDEWKNGQNSRESLCDKYGVSWWSCGVLEISRVCCNENEFELLFSVQWEYLCFGIRTFWQTWIDPFLEKYWLQNLPYISKNIRLLPCVKELK